MNNKPKILFYDLETSPNILTSWGLWVNGGLSHDNLIQERYIICGSWKWQGDPKVYSVAVDPADPTNDLPVVLALHEAISQADVIVAHNGDSFDIKWLNARMVHHQIAPLPPVIQIDTKKVAKAKFRFNSNRLDYLARFLGFGKKIKTEFDLWKDCMKGDVVAIEKMVRYNKHDVVLLEKVYNRIIPYVPAKLNLKLFKDRDVCESCGSKDIQYRGFAYTKANKWRRYQCTCGAWHRSNKAEKRVK